MFCFPCAGLDQCELAQALHRYGRGKVFVTRFTLFPTAIAMVDDTSRRRISEQQPASSGAQLDAAEDQRHGTTPPTYIYDVDSTIDMSLSDTAPPTEGPNSSAPARNSTYPVSEGAGGPGKS